MTVGGPCRVCSLPFDQRSEIDKRLREGHPVAQTGVWANKEYALSIPMRSYYNHHQRHVRAISRAVAKLTDGQRERRALVDTAKAIVQDKDFDAIAYLQVDQIARSVYVTSQRLEGAADDAYETKQHAALANLSGQLLRSAELRGKLGGSISDGSQLNLQVNLNALTTKVVEAMESDPERRRAVAAQLLLPNINQAAASSAANLGLPPEPADIAAPGSPYTADNGNAPPDPSAGPGLPGAPVSANDPARPEISAWASDTGFPRPAPDPGDPVASARASDTSAPAPPPGWAETSPEVINSITSKSARQRPKASARSHPLANPQTPAQEAASPVPGPSQPGTPANMSAIMALMRGGSS